MISQMINLQKRMAGLEDMDTILEVHDDFDEAKYPGTKAQYQEDLLKQIRFIINTVNKKGGNHLQYQVLNILNDSKTLRQLRNDLCSFVAENDLASQKANPKRDNISSK